MSHEQARQFVNEASEAIRLGAFQEALNSLERSIALDSSDSEAFVLRAVAYSHLNEPEKATESFREAISLAPHNQKAYYNFAVHLYALGDKAKALEMAREAMRLDSQHISSIDLVNRIERETGTVPAPDEPPKTEAPPSMAPPAQPQSDLSAPPQGAYYRGGYYDYPKPVHSLAFIERMGKGWNWTGWILTAIGGGGFVYRAVLFSRIQDVLGRAMNAQDPFGLQSQVGNITLGLLFDFVALIIIVYMCLDIADRRENWLWILPNAIACCCFGGNFLVLGVYLLFGRSSR